MADENPLPTPEQSKPTPEQINAAFKAYCAKNFTLPNGKPLDITKPGAIALLMTTIERKRCPQSFYFFVRRAYEKAFNEPFVDGWHIAAMCYALQALWDGTLYAANGDPSDTLVVNLPPGCGKSRIACVLYPSWIWLKDPTAGLWFSSFGQGLCDRDALDARRLITSPWYRATFWPDISLLDDQNQKRRFGNDRGGWRLSASIESKVGFGEHPRLLVCDDPHDPEQGASATQRQVAIDVWTNKFSTRGIVKGVKKLVDAQRLAEEDLSGYILANEDAVGHLCIPMEYEPERQCKLKMRYEDIDTPDANNNCVIREEWCDPRTEKGQLMWPAGMDQKKVDKLKRRLRRAHAIAGQLQQRPTAADGDLFLGEWFVLIDSLPADIRGEACRAWDLASATGTRADFTAGVLAIYDGSILYILDASEHKLARAERNTKMNEVCDSDAERFGNYHVRFEYEGGAGGKDGPEILAESMKDRHRVVIDKPLGKPDVNDSSLKGWETWADLLSRGCVRLVKGAWNHNRFIEQHLAAPYGKNDDMIDSASRAARGLYRRLTKSRINRPLLLLTPEDEESLRQDAQKSAESRSDGKVICINCGGLGCEHCSDGFVVQRSELQQIFDDRCAEMDAVELGVRL